jgi:hypothetical protein
MTLYPETWKLCRGGLQPGEIAEVWIADVGGKSAELVYATEALLPEAPNWAPDGRRFLLRSWSPDSRRFASWPT